MNDKRQMEQTATNICSDSRTTNSLPRTRWRFWLKAILALPVLYIVGYFVLMDRSRPEAFGEVKNYQSSFRWAGPMLGKGGEPTKFPATTIWNEIYDPMDNLYFKLFPRSLEEKKRMRDYGYDIRDLK